MKRLLIGIVGLMFFAGCEGAGTASQLVAFDNINYAADEAIKGLTQFKNSSEEDSVRIADSFLMSVWQDAYNFALSKDETPENAKANADKLVENIKGAFANIQEQEKRRSELYSITLDNMNFIKEMCDNARQFELYRSDISLQAKLYFSALQSRIKTVPEEGKE